MIWMCDLYTSCDQAGISKPLLGYVILGLMTCDTCVVCIGMWSMAVTLWRVPKRRSPCGSLMALLTGAAPATPGSTRTRLDEEHALLTLWFNVCCVISFDTGLVISYNRHPSCIYFLKAHLNQIGASLDALNYCKAYICKVVGQVGDGWMSKVNPLGF